MAGTETLDRPLTPRQKQVLVAIERWHRVHGYAPTTRELTEEIGLSSPSTLHHHLYLLRLAGAVTWRAGEARTLTITEAGRSAL